MISKGHLLGKQEDNIAKDDFSMSLTITIISIFTAWMAVAIAMLWGLLRVARRHQPVAPGRNGCHQVAPAPSGLNHRAVISLKGSTIETAFHVGFQVQCCDHSLSAGNVFIKGVGSHVD